jgi:peptide/nickel transport system permease protein
VSDKPQPAQVLDDRSLAKQPRTHGYWGIVARRFRKDRRSLFAVSLILFLFAIAVLAPLLANDVPIVARVNGDLVWPIFSEDPRWERLDWQRHAEDRFVLMPPHPFGPSTTDLDSILQPPSREHPLGTDHLGRDVLSRMLHGTIISLSIGFVVAGISLAIGIVMGALAGYFGGWVDQLISRLIDVMMSIPSFFLILAIIAFLPPSIWNVMIGLGVIGWAGLARLVRAEFLRYREMEYADAARAMGAGDLRIIFRHILPNALTPVWVSAAFRVAGAILVEAGLSFLGFGVPPPTPSWGSILSLAKQYISIAWWLATFPGLAIFVTVTAYNLLGEGLRDAMDPRLLDIEKK